MELRPVPGHRTCSTHLRTKYPPQTPEAEAHDYKRLRVRGYKRGLARSTSPDHPGRTWGSHLRL